MAFSTTADAAADSAFAPDAAEPGVSGSRAFWAAKRLFDIALSLALAAPVAVVGLGLALANPRMNPGPLLFSQRRMGRGGRPFTAWKFRTMRSAQGATRGPDDPLEVDRIPPLGRVLRRSRIDELPQIWNVLTGEMSFVGPRPDVWEHAVAYCDTVPGYRERHVVRPGISGLAQVRMGYAEGTEMTVRKVRQDLIYLRRAGWRLEGYVVAKTLGVLSNGFGAR
jgi:lipopolysaccharide/colanic/teichoic acid biosynthesis glycosyltransferase